MSSSAAFPLTPLDAGHQGSIFVTAWLLEGDIDVEALRGALTRLTAKWRLIAGRLQSYEGLVCLLISSGAFLLTLCYRASNGG